MPNQKHVIHRTLDIKSQKIKQSRAVLLRKSDYPLSCIKAFGVVARHKQPILCGKTAKFQTLSFPATTGAQSIIRDRLSRLTSKLIR